MTRPFLAAVAGLTVAAHTVACHSSPSVSTAAQDDSVLPARARAMVSADTGDDDGVSASASYPPSPARASEPALLYMGARRSGNAIRSVLRTREDFEPVWRAMWANWKGAPPAPPALDFTREMVIVAAMGGVDGAARRIGVTRATDRNSVLKIAVEIQSVDPKCDSFARAHYPVVMVTVPATASSPVFEDRVIQVPC